MKKLLLALPFLAVLSFSSCGKSYTCHCVYTSDGTTSHEDNTKINEGKKSKTQAACEKMSYSNSYEVGGQAHVDAASCTLQ